MAIGIIDAHAHVDEYEAFGWFDPPEALIGLLDEAGIGQAVVMTYADAPVLKPDALRYLHDACKKYPDRLSPTPASTRTPPTRPPCWKRPSWTSG